MPAVVVIGGPNGAGKSTVAPAILDALGIATFVNADVIARGLNAFDPDSVAFEAGRLMLRRLDELAEEGADFGFESTLASRSFAPWLAKLREERGYRVELRYVWVPDPGISIDRVAARVSRGGHHVEPEIVRRRWRRSVLNFFELYLPIADGWAAYANLGAGPVVVATRDRVEGPIEVYNRRLWEQLRNSTRAR